MTLLKKRDHLTVKKINLLKLIYEGEVSLREKEPKFLEEVEEYFQKKYDF